MLQIDLIPQDIIAGICHRAEHGGPGGEPASSLPPDALAVPGLTAPSIRHFLQILCKNANYLEIGSLMGATALAASWGNQGKYWALDNFSEWDTVRALRMTGLPCVGDFTPVKKMTMREAMDLTLDQFGHPFKFHQEDSLDFDLDKLGRECRCHQCGNVLTEYRPICPGCAGEVGDGPTLLDVFYYDADHSMEATRDNIIKFSEIFADEVVVCCDDYASPPVANGVKVGLACIPYELEWMFTLKWWNGFFIAGLSRER